MLLPSFEQGTVFLKRSLPVRVPLNYDAGMATMRYMDGNQIMELLNIEDIDRIHIGTHHFVPIRGKFCEVFHPHTDSKSVLLVDWCMSNVHVGYKGAMGVTSQVKGHSVNISVMGADLFGDMRSIHGSTDVQTSNNSQDVYKTRYYNVYYLYRDGKARKFKNKKQLLKLFPGRTDEVERVLRHHHVDFQMPQTVIDAVLDLLPR